MPPIELTFFSVTLFLALVALLEWKRRRMQARLRVRRGLREYVENRTAAGQSREADKGEDHEPLVIAQ